LCSKARRSAREQSVEIGQQKVGRSFNCTAKQVSRTSLEVMP